MGSSVIKRCETVIALTGRSEPDQGIEWSVVEAGWGDCIPVPSRHSPKHIDFLQHKNVVENITENFTFFTSRGRAGKADPSAKVGPSVTAFLVYTADVKPQ